LGAQIQHLFPQYLHIYLDILTLKLTPTYQCDFRHQRSDLPVTYVLMSDMFDTPGHRGIEILILTVNPDAQLHWTVC